MKYEPVWQRPNKISSMAELSGNLGQDQIMYFKQFKIKFLIL